MHKTIFFDLFARLIKCSIISSKHNEFNILGVESEEYLLNKVELLLNSMFYLNNYIDKIYTHYNLPLNSQKVNDIMEKCKTEDNYYYNKILISRLDSMVNMDELKKDISIDTVNVDDNGMTIESLNSNVRETGIIILPRFKKPLRTHIKFEKDKIKTIPHKEADTWSDEINSILKHLYYIKVDDLKGFKIKNIFMGFKEIEKFNLNVGYTPLLNDPITEVMDYDDDIEREDEKNNKYLYFGNVRLLYPSKIEKKFLLCYKRACKEKVDVIFAPEMLGTEKLSCTDELGYNSLFVPKAENDFCTPFLTLVPTYWHNRKNVLSIYSSSGKKLIEQYKQKGFKLKGKKGVCTEDLTDSPKEIAIIHIDGLGRLVFPICADYLDEEYRNIIITKLKASFILCPSYSFGTSNFEQLVSVGSAYGVRCIWGNCCSAISGRENAPDYPCIVSTPIISEGSEKVRVHHKCKGECREMCLFKIAIPLNCVGENIHEDININYEHLLE